jgi:hypothetical protein
MVDFWRKSSKITLYEIRCISPGLIPTRKPTVQNTAAEATEE